MEEKDEMRNMDDARLWDDDIQEEEQYRLQKSGAARFFELLGRDFGSFYKASLLFMIGILPGLTLIYFSIMAKSLPGALLGGILGGILGGTFLAGLVDTILRSLREEAGLWWPRYRKAWKQNWKQSLIPGMAMGIFFSIWAWILLQLPDMEEVPVMVWISMILGMIFALILVLYLFIQLVLIQLPLGKLVKNSGMFLLGFLPQGLAAGIVMGVYWALSFLYMPYSIVVLMITGAWFPVLIGLMLLYPPVNRVLQIEKKIEEKRTERYREIL